MAQRVQLALEHVFLGMTLAVIVGTVVLSCLGPLSAGLPDILAGIASTMFAMGVVVVLLSAAIACALGYFEPYWRSAYAWLAVLMLLSAGLLKAISEPDSLWSLGGLTILGYGTVIFTPKRKYRFIPLVVLVLSIPAFCMPTSWCPVMLSAGVLGACNGSLIGSILCHRSRSA